MKFTKLKLDKKNRMIRLGGGLNDGNWFFRLDIWFVGIRLTK